MYQIDTVYKSYMRSIIAGGNFNFGDAAGLFTINSNNRRISATDWNWLLRCYVMEFVS